MNQSKIMSTKMLFVVGLGLVTVGSSNAMDHSAVKIDNQKHWNMFLVSFDQPGHLNKVKINKPKSKVKSNAKSKSKKIYPASEARNAYFFHRELNRQKNELAATRNKADQHQAEKAERKYTDRLKKQLADEKKQECVKYFARNSARR